MKDKFIKILNKAARGQVGGGPADPIDHCGIENPRQCRYIYSCQEAGGTVHKFDRGIWKGTFGCYCGRVVFNPYFSNCVNGKVEFVGNVGRVEDAHLACDGCGDGKPDVAPPPPAPAPAPPPQPEWASK